MKIRGFVHMLKALEPRIGELVIVGGWGRGAKRGQWLTRFRSLSRVL
jgi:hypothetical protein